MAYTITNRWTGKPLYVAKNASDVREAVEAAVKERANLRDAYLRDANLRDAYLRDANLGGADLGGADLGDANLGGADLCGAYLGGADLGGAYLRGADLGGAYLGDANLGGAYLGDANLGDANLRDAYLRDANLGGAQGLDPHRVNDLLILLDQVGPIRAYKLVTAEGTGPTYPSITYEVGKTYEVKKPDTDPLTQCGAGINLATLPWCLREWRAGHRILVCEFKRDDIAAIPISDGKFRVSKAKVVREIPEADIRKWLGLNDTAPQERTKG